MPPAPKPAVAAVGHLLELNTVVIPPSQSQQSPDEATVASPTSYIGGSTFSLPTQICIVLTTLLFWSHWNSSGTTNLTVLLLPSGPDVANTSASSVAGGSQLTRYRGDSLCHRPPGCRGNSDGCLHRAPARVWLLGVVPWCVVHLCAASVVAFHFCVFRRLIRILLSILRDYMEVEWMAWVSYLQRCWFLHN